MKTCISILALAGFLTASSFAADAPAAPAAAVPAKTPAAPAVYVAKTKSSFMVTTGQVRNPFWPIGFYPQPKTANKIVEDQLLRIPVEMFRVTSIFAGDDGIAVINGKDYAKGQFLTVPTATGVARILITRIEDGYIIVQYKTLVARIPISRK